MIDTIQSLSIAILAVAVIVNSNTIRKLSQDVVERWNRTQL